MVDVYGEVDRARLGREFQRRALTDENSVLRRAAARLWPTFTPLGTPFFYATFRPLAGASYDDALYRYRSVCLVSLLAGLVLLARVLGLSVMTTLVVLAVLTNAFEPLRADVRVGNVNQLQLAMLAGILWLGTGPDRSRLQFAAGATLALAVAFKPNVVAVVPLLVLSWALERRWDRLFRQCAGMAAGGAAALIAVMLLFGSLRVWLDWFRIVTTMPPSMIPLGAGNFGLERILYERFGIEAGPYLAITTGGALAVCVWSGSRRRRSLASFNPATPAMRADAAVVGASCLVYMLSASMVWLHYLLLALPAALVLLGTRGEGIAGAATRVLAGIGLAAIAIDPGMELGGIEDLSRQAMVASAGLLLLFLGTLREIALPH